LITSLAVLLGLEFDAEAVRQRAVAGGHRTVLRRRSRCAGDRHLPAPPVVITAHGG
jgi:hypothetical protein